MIRHLSLILLAAAAATAGCQMEKEAKSPGDETPKPFDETPKPMKVISADVSIASVAMIQDCPDPKPAAKAAPEAATAEMAPEGARRSQSMPSPGPRGLTGAAYVPPCQQSFMQIAITGQGESGFKFSVAQVRVLDSAGARLGTVKTRMPTIWKSSGYDAWDETVMPGDPVKASYKVSMPTWDDESKQVGPSPYGSAYMFEADVLIDGVSKTVRSSLVSPQPAEIIQT